MCISLAVALLNGDGSLGDGKALILYADCRIDLVR